MLVSAVIQEIIDEAVLDLSTTEMLPYMKSALRQISTILKYRGFITEGTLSVASGAQSASLSSLSSGFILERDVWYVSNGSRIEIDAPQSPAYFNSIYTTTGSGKPEYYKINGTTMIFDKPLDEAITIGIEYFKEISAIALSDTFLGDERVIQAAKHLCLARYYRLYEEDKAKSDDEAKDGLGLLMKVQDDFESQDLAGDVEVTEFDGM